MRRSTIAFLCAVTGLAMTSRVEAQDIATKSGTIGAAEAGKGQVVFYRPGSIAGMALGCTIREDGAEQARLGSGKYYALSVAPGKHVYTTQSEAKDVLTLDVEPGETYFVKCKIGAGIMAGRPNLSPADATEFAAKAKGLKLWAGATTAE